MRVNVIFVVLLTISVGFSGCALIPDVVTEIDDVKSDLFANEIVQWAREGVESRDLTRIARELVIPTEWQRLDWATFGGLKASITCTICKAMSKAVLILRRSGIPADTIQQTIANVCTLLNIQTRSVCNGVVRLNANQRCGPPPPRYNWTVEVDNSPPLHFEVEESTESLKILQITDIHFDPLYEPGGNADCHEPTCCRRGQNNTGGNRKSAGFWGDFNNCDVPWHAVLDALDETKTRHGDADLIYFTGDVIDHGVWETSRSVNSRSLHKIFKKMKETFRDRPVYPIFGNHEPHPLNQFAPDDIDEDSLSTKWLYALLANIWIDAGWLPESTRSTILQGGFYTVTPKKGFRIIAINNNVAYIYNWWLLYKPNDLNGQLRWLADTLLEAERNQEIVHILGHMPGGSHHFQHTWSREYRKIVNRFAHIIAAQFNGHTHNDEFNLFYHPDNKSRIITVAWNGGSITPYTNLNPNYKIYQANAKTYQVENADTWFYNLTEANLTPNQRPRWHKMYSFKEEYGLDNLSKESLHSLITDMAKGGRSLEIYHKNFYKHAAPQLDKNCDRKCMQHHVCAIVTSSSDDKSECRLLEGQNEAPALFPAPQVGALPSIPLITNENSLISKKIIKK
ncbi:sphingomyelin phosphodiesterase isoform X2 [Diachasma alloeum]|uniref:sphingomyelin phosphodiesterase isoform X2 n=1 Tax=Diachasma alloeum TaxID=454923 RepID=UPI0007381204|nr:sphingomyelin phosphodiesterase isoform X2 [Diachasma alloeum]